MRKVYICSPYRADDSAQLDRNIRYAQELTKQAIKAGLAPITPHLYMPQCLNEDKPEEREAGLAAGLELLKSCAFVIAGVKYGISEGMSREIQTADELGIEVVNADKLPYKLEYGRRQETAKAIHRSMDRIFSPCDECGYSFSKQNQGSGMCEICEFKMLQERT